VDQSLPNFFHSTQASFPILDICVRYGDIRAQSGKWSEIVPNFWPRNYIFGPAL